MRAGSSEVECSVRIRMVVGSNPTQSTTLIHYIYNYYDIKWPNRYRKKLKYPLKDKMKKKSKANRLQIEYDNRGLKTIRILDDNNQVPITGKFLNIQLAFQEDANFIITSEESEITSNPSYA